MNMYRSYDKQSEQRRKRKAALNFYKRVKSKVVISFEGEVYIPTFPNHNNGKISLGNINDKNFNQRTRGLDIKILKNLSVCSQTGIIYPKHDQNGRCYFPGQQGLHTLGCIPFEDREKKKKKEYYKRKRILQQIGYHGTEYPYENTSIEELEILSNIVKNAFLPGFIYLNPIGPKKK